MEAGTFGHLMPSEVTLGDLLRRYLNAVTPGKKGAPQEARRIRRLLSATPSACTQSTDCFHTRSHSSATEDYRMAFVQVSMIW